MAYGSLFLCSAYLNSSLTCLCSKASKFLSPNECPAMLLLQTFYLFERILICFNMVLHSGTNFNLDIGAFWCSQFLVHWDFDCVQEQLSGAMCYKLCMAYHVCLSSLYAPLTTTVFDWPFSLVQQRINTGHNQFLFQICCSCTSRHCW